MSDTERFCMDCGYFFNEQAANTHEDIGHEVKTISMDIFGE